MILYLLTQKYAVWLQKFKFRCFGWNFATSHKYNLKMFFVINWLVKLEEFCASKLPSVVWRPPSVLLYSVSPASGLAMGDGVNPVPLVVRRLHLLTHIFQCSQGKLLNIFRFVKIVFFCRIKAFNFSPFLK